MKPGFLGGTPSTPVRRWPRAELVHLGSAEPFTSDYPHVVRPRLDSDVSVASQIDFARSDETLILFDYDDTLCPSNWIRENRPVTSFFKPAPTEEKYQRPLRELQEVVEKVAVLQDVDGGDALTDELIWDAVDVLMQNPIFKVEARRLAINFATAMADPEVAQQIKELGAFITGTEAPEQGEVFKMLAEVEASQ